MDSIIPFSTIDLATITNHRSGEIKFGEKMQTVPTNLNPIDYLYKCDAQFVLFGIPEDIGVRANFGRLGTSLAWQSAIKNIANLQHNKYCKGSQILILGSLNVSNLILESQDLDITINTDRTKFSKIIEKIDKEVSHIIYNILKSGKTPIVIGGGHNNAYGNIKGAALAKGKPINVINFDAHTDFRDLEGRHSGNGFSYAFDEGFIKKYFIFGIHENYTSKNILLKLKQFNDRIKFNTYDEIAIRGEKNYQEEITIAKNFISDEPFGVEIDLDAIPNIPSSAMTLSGFSVEQARQFVYNFGNIPNATYLHICEGAPNLSEEKNEHLTGKLIGYLVTDFIKARNNLLIF